MTPKHEYQSAGISDEQIAERAYQIWREKGAPEGDDGRENWEVAKTQLLNERRRNTNPLKRLIARLRNRAAF